MSRPHIRDLGYGPGYYKPGPKNSIFDVPSLQVGQKTIHDEKNGIHVGVTIIYPRGTKGTRTQPSYAAMHTLNGGGEMTSQHFVDEWGFTNSPIAFTDSMSCGAVYQALTKYSWELSRSLGESEIDGYAHHGWPVVGETWGGGLTDIHDGKSTLSYDQVKEAIDDAETRTIVAEGGYGGGAGMMCQGHKGGTGTSSRIVLGAGGEEYVVGVLVQSNYGQKAMLHIGGVPIGKLLIRDEVENQGQEDEQHRHHEGSIIVAVVTNAPLLPHQLRRLAIRATFGIVAVGGHGVAYNTSGDILIALSTSESCAPQVLMKQDWERPTPADYAKMGGRPNLSMDEISSNGFRRLVETQDVQTVVHSSIDSLFVAVAEATEEAILNSMCQAEDLKGHGGMVHKALDTERTRELLEKYRTW